jgi:hypothetical protein
MHLIHRRQHDLSRRRTIAAEPGRVSAKPQQQQEANMDHYKNVPIIDILKVAGLNADLSTVMGDPRNVAYIGPLEDPADEDMAEGMAAAI